VEFVHVNIKSVITQRELGQSTQSFSEALKAAVREAPDVILVGEMRDLETMQMALHAAETGLLVFATMHTNSASRTVDRLVNVFPTDEQPVVRNGVSGTLRGILAQQLIQTKNGDRVPAVEILFGSTALGNLLKEGKTSQIDTMIVTGKRQGMVLMDESLMNLVREGLVEPRQAYEKSISKESFRKRLMDEMGIRVLKEEEEIGLK
ncbi:MAG: Flp pilus assembly complex ATPase component TadA, partial [Deltaproteobacteria bacterium]|nr:Flp pilus assembly complex ATPase component TadA [Deltaproteobacteria bacterium]